VDEIKLIHLYHSNENNGTKDHT